MVSGFGAVLDCSDPCEVQLLTGGDASETGGESEGELSRGHALHSSAYLLFSSGWGAAALVKFLLLCRAFFSLTSLVGAA